MRTMQLVLAAVITAFASPAFAGAAIYHLNGGEDCACDSPLPRVIYGVAPVPTPAYRVDQGPSFDIPATGYARPRVYTTEPDDYPYVNGAADDADDGYAPSYDPVYGAPYVFSPRRERHRHWARPGRRDVGGRVHAPRVQPLAPTYLAPPRLAPAHVGPSTLTGVGGVAHAQPAPALAGGPRAHVRAPVARRAPIMARPAGGGRR